MKPSQKSAAAEPAPDPRARLVGLVLALVTVLVYLPVCFHDFIYFDDPSYVTDNPVVQGGLTWAGFKWAFLGWHAGNWHPLTWLSLELDCQLFGLNAGAQHFVNVLFHASSTVLLFRLWYRLTKALWPAAFVAALFAWHPLHVESVAWIAERKDVLSTFFGLLALLGYTRYAQEKSRRGFWLAVLFFALSLLAKPMLVTLPFILLLLDFWPLARVATFSRLVLEKWPFFLLAAISCVITFLAQRGQAVISLQQFTLGQRAENALVAYLSYLGKIIWPVDLGIFYPLPDHFPTAVVLLAAAVLAGISLLAWRRRKTSGWLLTGWLWFLGTLVPVIGLVQVGDQAMADRYTYLPAVGLFVAFAFELSDWFARFKSSLALPVITAVILLACVAVTEYQLAFWRDTVTIFTRTLAVTTRNGPAHMMLGVAHEKSGEPDEALKQYAEALRCAPALVIQVDGGEKRPLAAQVQLLLGQSAEKDGRPDDALGRYREALQVDPDLVEAHNNLGNLLDALGKSGDALAEYQAAVQLRPALPLVHENLGTQLAKLGRLTDALQEYQTAAQLEPSSARPFYLMGKACLRAGQTAEAVAKFQTALQLDPDDYQTQTFLARVLAADPDPQVRNGASAVALAEKADDLTHHEQPFVLGTLAMAYAEAGRFTDAQKTVQTALQLTAAAHQDSTALQAQLRAYESNQPWREDFTNAPVTTGH